MSDDINQTLFSTGQMGGHNAGGNGAYAGLDQAILGMAGIALPNTKEGFIPDSQGFIHGNIPAMLAGKGNHAIERVMLEMAEYFAKAGEGIKIECNLSDNHSFTPLGGNSGHGMVLGG